MKKIIEMFIAFFKIGAFTFGGGYAMLPILQKEIVENKKWATNEEIMDYYAIGQCTPGVIALNTSTFIGYKLKGTIGGIIATLGFLTPSLIIIMIIAKFLSNFANIPLVIHAFAGIRVCVCILILNAVIKLSKSSIIDKPTVGIFIGVILFSLLTNLSPAIFVLITAVAGIIIKAIGGKKE